jgi:hypothetical protein
MLDAIKQAGTAYKMVRLTDQFAKTLTPEQKGMLDEMKASARGMAGNFLPEEAQPILDYVLADDGDSIVVKAIGAYFHPTVKQTLGQLLPQPDTQQATHENEPVSVRCRKCGHMAQYGLHDVTDA